MVCVFLEYEWAWVCNIRDVKIGHLMYYCIFARTKNLANLIAVRRWAFAIPLISWGSNWIAKHWTLNIAYYFSIPNKRSIITKAQTNQEGSNICWGAPKRTVFFFKLSHLIRWSFFYLRLEMKNWDLLRYLNVHIFFFKCTLIGQYKNKENHYAVWWMML